MIVVEFPWWASTFAGTLFIAMVAMFGTIVAQARLVDALDLKTSILQAETGRVLAENARTMRDVRAKNEQLAELQRWRVVITIASRSGWDAAHRYIRETRLDLPAGASEEGL